MKGQGDHCWLPSQVKQTQPGKNWFNLFHPHFLPRLSFTTPYSQVLCFLPGSTSQAGAVAAAPSSSDFSLSPLWGPSHRIGEGTAPVWVIFLQENYHSPPPPPSRLAVLLGACALHGLAMHCSFLQGVSTAVGLSAQIWSPQPAGENLLPLGPLPRLQDTCCCSALVSVGLFLIFSSSHLPLAHSCCAVLFTLLNVTTVVLPASLMGSALASRGAVGVRWKWLSDSANKGLTS